MKDLSTRFFLASLCGLFILLGLAFISYAGIQNDEALFANPIYQNSFEFKVRIQHHTLPVMVMSYIGTLKTLIYWLIWSVFPPSLISLRLPMILAGAATILLFFYLTLRIADARTASMAAALLATDPAFLLTDTFDWGPVALEHLLLVTACFLLVRYARPAVVALHHAARNQADLNQTDVNQTDPNQSDVNHAGSNWDLALGFVVLGLAVWNKAIFLWSLGGLTVAALLVCWRDIRRLLTPRTLGIAAAGFLFGALPLVIYNVKRPNVTLASNTRLEWPAWGAKATQVRSALDGSGLFGYLVADEPGPLRQAPASAKGRAAAWIHDHGGEHQRSGMFYALLAGLALVPWWWRSRAPWFALIFIAVTWLLMAITREGGTSLHHTVLLWPFPQLFVALALSSIRWRGAAAACAAVLCVWNLLVLNQYAWQFEQYGADRAFSDAINTLSGRLDAYRDETIYMLDWGMQNSVALLHRGKLRLEVADGPFETDTPDSITARFRSQMFHNPEGVFVGHTAGQEYFTGVRDRFRRDAAAAGLREDILETVSDAHGRPVFEIFRLAPVGGPRAGVP